MRVFHVAGSGNLTLINFTISGGMADADDFVGGVGGGILNEGGLSLSNCVVADNSALGTTNAPGEGGGIYNSGTVIAENSSVINNTALASGGIFQLGDGAAVFVNLTNCLVSNPASGHDTFSTVANGGQATILAVDSTISNPASPSVGAINDQFITGSATIPVYLTSTNYHDVQLTVQSANTNVAPAGSLSLSGTGNLRQLGLTPADDGIANVTVMLSEKGVAFGRGFTVGTDSGTPINPITTNTSFTVYQGQTTLLPVLENDVDPSGLPLQLVSVSPAAGGSTVILSNEVLYANSGGAATNDSFTYVVADAFGGSATGQVSIAIAPPQLIVNNLYQTSPGSLGDALSTANSNPLNGHVPWTILIDPSLAGQTLTLLNFVQVIADGGGSDYTGFVITNYVVIDGSQAPGFVLAGNTDEYNGPPMRHFRITSTGTLKLVDLELTDGVAWYRGTPLGTLADGNHSGYGGSIFNQGTFCATNVLFADNTAQGDNDGTTYPGLGGAIFNDGGQVKIAGSTFYENVAEGDATGWNITSNLTGAYGGAIFNYNGSMTLFSNIFQLNSAYQGASVASVGDGIRANLFLSQNLMTNTVPALDLVGEAVNGGFSAMVSYQTNLLTQGDPAISTIPDQAVSNVVAVPFSFNFASTNPVLTASSSNPSVIPNARLVIATNGNSGTLTMTPANDSGTAAITVLLTDGDLSYAEVFSAVFSPAVITNPFVSTLVASENPSGFKDRVDFTATQPPAATGNVMFFTNSVPLSTNTLSNGSATSAATALLPRGTNVIVAQYAGDGTYPGATNTLLQVVTNHPPVASVMIVTRPNGLNVKIPLSDLATNWSDPDGDLVRLIAVHFTTTNGVPVYPLNLTTNLDGSYVITNIAFLGYVNPLNVDDQITYTISDGHGGTNQGQVDIVVSTSPMFGQTTSLVPSASGGVTLKFAGQPGYTYDIQRSTNLTAWVTIWTTNAPPAGPFRFTDTYLDLGGTPPASAYYRLSWVP